MLTRCCIQPFGLLFINSLKAFFRFFGVHFKRTYAMFLAFNRSKRPENSILSARLVESVAEVCSLKLVSFLANSGCIFAILD